VLVFDGMDVGCAWVCVGAGGDGWFEEIEALVGASSARCCVLLEINLDGGRLRRCRTVDGDAWEVVGKEMAARRWQARHRRDTFWGVLIAALGETQKNIRYTNRRTMRDYAR
jgi:hypothetical protein